MPAAKKALRIFTSLMAVTAATPWLQDNSNGKRWLRSHRKSSGRFSPRRPCSLAFSGKRRTSGFGAAPEFAVNDGYKKIGPAACRAERKLEGVHPSVGTRSTKTRVS